MLKLNENFGVNNRFKILTVLGSGGMGTVYKAYDNILKENVAIKTLNKELSKDESVKNRFLNEAKICLALTHPNIIRVRDVSIYNDIYFMVMEYIDGVELKSIMKDMSKDDIKSIYNIIRPILLALDYAHNFTIHRDIKPANIMIKDNKPYLMDFGISKALEDSELTNHTVIGGMGTKKYVSPEQTFNANDVDKKTDIYSMGILLYELFTKYVPKNTAIVQADKASIHNNILSSSVDNILLKMIEVKPNLRPENFSQIIQVLDNEILNNNSTIKNDINITVKNNTTKNIDDKQFSLDDDFIFIKKGNYLRGSGIESKIEIEKPRKSIFTDSFYINKYCVTNKQYSIFLEETNYNKPKNFDINLKTKPNHPVVYVSYVDANEYCKYYGYSLPSEAQWEKVAKGKNFIYPWGNTFDTKANIGHIHNDTVAVDEYENGKSFNGIYNMAGNVWEWCIDDFTQSFYKEDITNNPISCTNSDTKVLRGGSFDFVINAARTSFRFGMNYLVKENNIGFRVVKNIKNEEV